MKIVVVDPSRTVRHIVSDMVRHWGYAAETFARGEEALSHLRSDCNDSRIDH